MTTANEHRALLSDENNCNNNNNYYKTDEVFDQSKAESSSPKAFVIKRSSSAFSAGWNITNIIQGIGILGIPYAMLKGSWIGIFMNLFSAYICCFTGKMIVDCLYEKTGYLSLNKKVREDYSDIGDKVWPKCGGKFVIIMSFVEMFGVSTLYVILLGSCTHRLFKTLLPSLTEQHWCIICCSLVLTLLFIKQMAFISRFSFIAIIGLMGTILSIIIYCIIRYKDIRPANIPKISILDIPISMGIIVFSYCAHPLLPAIEASMSKPEQFNRTINVSFIISVTTKITFGIIPLMIFGKRTFQTVIRNIAIADFGFYIATHIFVLINVFFSMPLVLYVLSEKIDQVILVRYFHNIFWPQNKLHFIWMLTSRIIILSSVLLTALIVPYFGLVMSFIGSFTGTCLTFIFPCWFSLVLKSKELNKREKVYRIAIIICGIFFGINGMIFASKEMYRIANI